MAKNRSFTVEELHGGHDGDVWMRDRACGGRRQQVIDEIVMSWKQLMLVMLEMMSMIVRFRRRWRRAGNAVHAELLLTGRTIFSVQCTILTLVVMVMLPMISNLLLVLMWKSLLGRRSVELRLLSSGLFFRFIGLQ